MGFSALRRHCRARLCAQSGPTPIDACEFGFVSERAFSAVPLNMMDITRGLARQIWIYMYRQIYFMYMYEPDSELTRTPFLNTIKTFVFAIHIAYGRVSVRAYIPAKRTNYVDGAYVHLDQTPN